MGQAASKLPQKKPFVSELAKARQFIQSQEWDKARQVLHAILQKDKKLDEAWHLLGAVHYHEGNFAESIEFFKQCLFLNPQHFRCTINLGICYREQQQFGRAGTIFRQAIDTDPKHPDGHVNLCINYMEANDDIGWHLSVYQAVKNDPDNQSLHTAILYPLISKQKPEIAEAWLLRLHNLFPKTTAIAQYTAMLYEKNDQAEKGLPFIKPLVNANADNPNLLEVYGVLLHRNHDIEASRKVLNKVLKIDKNHAGAHHNLGISYFEQGEMEEGRKHLIEAIKLKPEFTQAYYSFSQIHKFKDKQDPYLKKMEKMLTAPKASEADQIELCFALGKASEDMKDYTKAFSYYKKGNQIKKFPYEKKALWDILARKQKCFTKEFFEERKGMSDREDAPIFIIGMPRSGTTLAEQIISSHKDVSAAGELGYISGICESMKLGADASQTYPDVLAHMNPEILKQMTQAYLDNTEKFRHGAKHVTDKMPYNFNHLGFIAMAFPNAKIVHCQRHPLDTISSCFSQNFRRLQKMGGTLESMADYYLYYLETMKLWKKVLPIEIIDLPYETLTANPDEEIKKLISACGLSWDDACLEFYDNKRHVRTASIWQVRQPIYQNSKNRWKRYEDGMKHLVPVLKKGGAL